MNATIHCIHTSFLENFLFVSVKIDLTLSEFSSVHISSKKNFIQFVCFDNNQISLYFLPYSDSSQNKAQMFSITSSSSLWILRKLFFHSTQYFTSRQNEDGSKKHCILSSLHNNRSSTILSATVENLIGT